MRGFTLIRLLLLRKRSCKGFTLIELLVVIAIMAILTVVAIPSYNEYSRSQKLNDAASQLQTVLRQAQNNAQTGTVCKISGTTYKASSWIVLLNSTSYSVLPVCDLSALLTPTPTPTSQQYLLPAGIIISKVKDIGTNCEVDPLSHPPTIGYKNLSSEVVFTLSSCTPGVNAVVEITLCLTDSTCLVSSQTKTVTVEKGGGIYVKQ